VAEASRALPGPAWLSEHRAAAFERVAGAALPSEGEEVWRYSRIGELDLAAYAPAPALPVAADTAGVAAAVLEAIGPRSALLETRNGHLSTLQPASGSVYAGGLGDAPPEVAELLDSVAWSTDALSDLASAFLHDAAVLVVPAGAELAEPVVIVHQVGDGTERLAAFPRTLVTLGEGASASVVEIVVSAAGGCYLGPVSELQVSDGARLAFHSLHRFAADSFSVARQASRVGRDAELVSFTAALGGDYARCRTDSVLDGQGGSSKLLAAFFAEGTQMQDWRTLQEHVAPKTSSDLLYKGAVAGSSRSVYSGLIRIRHGARGSNALQTNRNLVLSEGAHADSVPNLDIEENDVRCSHASAVGPIDADQRYYLESRGVPRDVAERLIVIGFFADLFERAPSTALRRYLPGELAARFSPSTVGVTS
jgi:Fe-S cluster assembly protein SufD